MCLDLATADCEEGQQQQPRVCTARSIVNNRRRIKADTALRLSLYFGNTPEFWMNLQAHYDLKVARRGLSPQEMRRIRARRAA